MQTQLEGTSRAPEENTVATRLLPAEGIRPDEYLPRYISVAPISTVIFYDTYSCEEVQSRSIPSDISTQGDLRQVPISCPLSLQCGDAAQNLTAAESERRIAEKCGNDGECIFVHPPRGQSVISLAMTGRD